MDEIIKLFKENGFGFLATVDNGKPRVRPFGFMTWDEGKLYFCTNSTKKVYKQLVESPYIEYSTTSKDMITGRISGKVIFSDDKDKKELVLNSSELVKKLYKSSDNPIFKIFYIEHGTATVSDLTGENSKEIKF
ncbi:pyridoxamine 5'-phosphate oxidase family protein [Clostridium sp. MT-14]|uniref:pyridoxamine 5'-phosphate oxidase family protein n=1 Tax=Clostridium sp. MT-14 TaxID=3348360 RepID=UPI0035F3D965